MPGARVQALRPPARAWQIRGVALDWRRVVLTEHMVEAAAVVGECHVAFEFEGAQSVAYEIKVYRALKGEGDPYFAVGVNRDDPAAYRPLGSAADPETALNACLANAGVYHRRLVKQQDG
jgi:hypothetical protein